MPPKRVTAAERERAANIYRVLEECYPDVRCTLDYGNAFHLLVMTILAAQCTDARVNLVCRTLFTRFSTPRDFMSAPAGALEREIHSCGFFNQKAKSIRETSRILEEEHGGAVPDTMEALLRLPGVGRKIANVILGECHGKPAVIVDTHCQRLAFRMGFTKREDPAGVERDLMRLWPEEYWTLFSHRMVYHGRAVCTARAPKCAECPVRPLCPRRGLTASSPRRTKAT